MMLAHLVPGVQADVASLLICLDSYVRAVPRGEEMS